jgi:hypothetical protein
MVKAVRGLLLGVKNGYLAGWLEVNAVFYLLLECNKP